MPRLSAWFVRVSLIYLAAGFSLGALLLANKGLVFYPPAWKVLPIHVEVLLLGWFLQLVMGVAYWILPRLAGATPRGPESYSLDAFWLVNTGIGLVILGVVLNYPALGLTGRLAEAIGGLLFVLAAWKRIKTFQG